MNLKEALIFLLNSINDSPKTEKISLKDADNRILAENLKSSRDIPPFNNSQVDGYAVNSSFLPTDSLVSVSQRIPAGSNPGSLEKNTTARIFTGAVIPKNCDAVVMQEQVEVNNEKISFKNKITPGQNIRKQGCDLRENQIFFEKGKIISAADIGMCASVGLKNLEVYKRLKIGVFSSGDELKQPGEKLLSGQIYDSNRPMILSLVKKLGFETLDMGRLPDNYSQTVNLLSKASTEVNVILTCGGVSVGEEDHIKAAVEHLGSVMMWKINIKPGKPFAFGSIGKSVFLGMPGNPVSAWVTFALICRPYLIKRAGGKNFHNVPLVLESNFELNKLDVRLQFFRGSVNDHGKLEIFSNQNSQILSSVCFSDGLIEIPINTRIQKGDKLNFYPFSQF